MRKRKPIAARLAIVSLVILIAIGMPMSSLSEGTGPTIEVTSHQDGDWLTSQGTLVEGTAASGSRSLVLDGEDFLFGEATGIEQTGESLALRPARLFFDDFSGNQLDEDNWEVLNASGNLSVSGGMLKLSSVQTDPCIPLVRSTSDLFPTNTDFYASFRMQFGSLGYSGAGGGISSANTEITSSHFGGYNKWQAYQKPLYQVFANGEMVHGSLTFDGTMHLYELDYSVADGTYTCFLDGTDIGTFTRNDVPSFFWFGKGEERTYWLHPAVFVDYVDLWTFSGSWTSDPFKMDEHTVLEGASVSWTSTDKAHAKVGLEVRTSSDNEVWSDWVAVEDGDLASPLEGTWMQVRMALALPDGRDVDANLQVTAIELEYHHPLTSVEVRRAGGEWTKAEGLANWKAPVDLSEDENVIEVRATDLLGSVNSTSFTLIADTTAPTGSMEIYGGQEYTNDRTVLLELEAFDKYGVTYVDIAGHSDFVGAKRVPFSSQVEWVMDGTEGMQTVHVRFVDAHGLVSKTYRGSMVLDTFPPVGEVTIDGGEMYTSDSLVDLAIAYSDNNGVARVELSNSPDLTKALEVSRDLSKVSDWELSGSEDGSRTVYMRITDLAGNTKVVEDTIELHLPKAIGEIVIENGAEYTSKAIVTLAIDVPLESRVGQMQLSNDLSFYNAQWEALAKETFWIITSGDGPKTVYARFRDFRDTVSLPVSANIILDTSPPNLEVVLDDGAAYTTRTTVNVRLDYADATAPARMWVTRDGMWNEVEPRPFEEAFELTIPARESDHLVFVRVEDAAGNVVEAKAVIHYATVRPVVNLVLPLGDVVKAGDSISLIVEPTDHYGGVEVQVAIDSDPVEEAPWYSVDRWLMIEVPEDTTDGTYEVRVRARNAAGLTSEILSIAIIVDNLPPELTIKTPVDGSTIPQKGRKIRLEVEAEDPNLVARVAFSVNGGLETELPDGELRADVTLEDYGEHTIEVVAEDRAGNVATDTTTFVIEDSSSVFASGMGVIGLIILVTMGIVASAAYGVYRVRLVHGPGTIHTGDGWHEDWTTVDGRGTTEGLEVLEEPESLETVGLEDPEDHLDLSDIDLSEVQVVVEEPVVKPGDGFDWEEFKG